MYYTHSNNITNFTIEFLLPRTDKGMDGFLKSILNENLSLDTAEFDKLVLEFPSTFHVQNSIYHILHLGKIGLIVLRRSDTAIDDYFLKTLTQILYKLALAIEKNRELKISNWDLAITQSQLIHSAKLAALGEMSTGLAHELNNPLFLIHGFAEVLKENIEHHDRKVDFDEMLDDANEILNNCNRMISLITYFREFSRISSKIFENVDIHYSVNRSLLFFKEQFRLNQVEVLLHLDANVFTVLGLTNRIEQVFVNLLSNSRDALVAKNSERKLIEIKTENEAGLIKIFFKDNGVGIDQKHMDRIADPFFTTKDVSHGTGLGLSIAHTIIDEINGKITWNSTLNEYTEFVITIPLKM